MASAVLTAVGALVFSLLPAGAAQAAPVYEIVGEWEDGTPTTVTSGNVVNGIWYVNVNDDAPAPGNGPVDDVTFTVTVQNGVFGQLPASCVTTGVDPASAISADGATLTCNLGTVNQGTAVVVQTPIEVDGPTGSQLTASGSIAGLTADLSPLDIVNRFGMDMRWGSGAAYISSGTNYFETTYEWTLSKLVRSDAGPQTIDYDLTIASPQGGTIQIAPQGCKAFDMGVAADGHPWSGGDHPATHMTSFVDSCVVTQTGPNTFRMTITGIDYEPDNPPVRDSAGSFLPTDQVALASGSIYVRIFDVPGGSATLTASAPTYTSTTGLTAQDDPANNSETKAWQPLGTYSSGWGRGYTGSGGTTWDDDYRVAAGTVVGQYLDTGWQRWAARDDSRLVGMCAALDTRYVTLENFAWGSPAGGVPGAPFEYYTGTSANLDPASASYNPGAFDCAPSTGWSTTPPANLADVKAVRVVMTQGQAEAHVDDWSITPVAFVRIRPETPAGTDVWSFFSGIHDDPVPNTWTGPDYAGCITNTPGWRYPCTTGFRDVLRIVDAAPAIAKTVDRAVVTPGVPATYTLTYAANGAGQIPATVDGYQIVDTLPLGSTYVSGSAAPAPAVSLNPSGQQVLTWTLDDVPTNTQNALTYQAVVDADAEPGRVFTNTATAGYGGVTTAPVAAQVTVASSGHTSIGKTADSPFIPNLAGDGVGEGSWTVTMRSFDPLPQDYTDTIDILPYVGDGRGTDFAGSYELTEVDAVAGATVYYTTADPTTLSDDPADPSNGAPGTPAGNTVGWSITFTADATAVRVIGPELASGATQAFTVHVATDGVEGGDLLVNRAQARAEHTELVMRTSAPITVANFYSASLKKYVQDADGEWRDANTVEDYPTYRVGDEVPYRIVIENTGQGTLTDLEITDSLFPEGSFTVDELAPGGSETHEYTVTLTGGGTVVNTACGAASVPADSGVAPTINCDPAGVEVVNYTTAKSSDPGPGTTLRPGDEVTYTVRVTQEGTAPAVAAFSDDLADVLDDADLTAGPTASVGTATVTDGVLSWTGTVPVGQVATVSYTVTITAAGDMTLTNVVTSDGCLDAASCTTTHLVGDYTVSKTSTPASGTDVAVGDTITYTVTVTQRGPGSVVGASFDDDLSAVLDDATWDDELTASAGAASFDPDAEAVEWSGDLTVGAVVTVTYSVTVTGAGDMTLTNVVTPGEDGECVPAADGNPGCSTTHETGRFEFSKMADPVHDSDVQAGDSITYTVTVTQVGPAAVTASVVDDLSDVLDDATYNADVTASAGEATVDGSTLSWSNVLAPGDEVTITYSVTVTGAGNTTLANVVTSPSEAGSCVTAADGTEGCRTIHKTGGYVYAKTADPASGATVRTGDTVTYTVTITQRGEGVVTDAVVTDDLSGVLDDATWNGDQAATAGAVARDGNTLTWTGALAVDQTVTVTYSVTVTATGAAQLRNAVTSPDERAICDPGGACVTTHDIPAPPPLAVTGGTISWAAAGLGGMLLIAGAIAVLSHRRRFPRASGGPER